MTEIKTFGEYLVEQNLVSQDSLLQIMISQIKDTPSISEIVYAEKLIDAPKIFAIVCEQAKKRQDFVSAANALGFWNEEVETKVYQYLEKHQKSIPEKLVENNLITFDQLNKYLDSFLYSESKPAIKEVGSGITQIAIVATEEPLVQKENTAEVLVFAEQFDENIKQRLLQLLASAENAAEHPPLIECLHRIAGAAKFARLQRMYEVFSSMEEKFSGIQGSVDVDPSFYQKFGTVSTSSMDAIWALRNHVTTTNEESGFHQFNPAMSQIIDLYLKYLHGAKND